MDRHVRVRAPVVVDELTIGDVYTRG
jgi:hypothetical protein